jgi:hypothetical protein
MTPNCGRSKESGLDSRHFFRGMTPGFPSLGSAPVTISARIEGSESADSVRICAKTGWFRPFHLC